MAGGSIIVKQIGHAVLTVDLPGGGKEEFLITLPRLRIDGLWYGSPYIELTETSYIQSSTGWLSTVRLSPSLSLPLPHLHSHSYFQESILIRSNKFLEAFKLRYIEWFITLNFGLIKYICNQ